MDHLWTHQSQAPFSPSSPPLKGQGQTPPLPVFPTPHLHSTLYHHTVAWSHWTSHRDQTAPSRPTTSKWAEWFTAALLGGGGSGSPAHSHGGREDTDATIGQSHVCSSCGRWSFLNKSKGMSGNERLGRSVSFLIKSDGFKDSFPAGPPAGGRISP